MNRLTSFLEKDRQLINDKGIEDFFSQKPTFRGDISGLISIIKQKKVENYNS